MAGPVVSCRRWTAHEPVLCSVADVFEDGPTSSELQDGQKRGLLLLVPLVLGLGKVGAVQTLQLVDPGSRHCNEMET